MLEHRNHAFIVRIWFEPRESSNLPVQWKGTVQHVASNRQRYFNHLEQLIAFIAQEADLPEPNDGLDLGEQ